MAGLDGTGDGAADEQSLGRARGFLQAAVLVVLGGWLHLKLRDFSALEYTSPDLSIVLQLSRSLWEKGAFLYDNVYGWHGALHGFYVLPALYPFTARLGAHGLFVALALAQAVALVWVARLPRLPLDRALALSGMALGPIGLWLFRDEIWGFHADLLYVPLALLLAALLESGARRAWLVLAGLAILSVREDGAVLLTCLLLARLWLRPGAHRRPTRRLRASLGIAALGALAFLLGLVLVRWQGSGTAPPSPSLGVPAPSINRLPTAEARVGYALESLRARIEDPNGRAALGRSALGTVALLASAALALGGLAGARTLAVFLPFSLPLYAVSLVASAGYPTAVHWLTWPPRFASLWGLFLGVALLSSRQGRPVRLAPALAWLALSWALQPFAVGWARSSAPIPGRSDIHAAPRLAPAERAVLDCVAAALPPRAPIVAERYMQASFHQQDWTWARRVERAWARPEIAVCDHRSPETDCKSFGADLARRGTRRDSRYLLLAGAGAAARVVEDCAPAETPPKP
jgi:hypothetical protein